MLRRLLLAILIAAPAMAADDACSDWASGNSGATDFGALCCTVTSTFTNIATTATMERSISLGAKHAVLLRIEVRSTNCADCDVVVQTVTGAAAGTVLYFNSSLASQAIGGTTYTSYANDLVGSDVTPAVVSSERRVYIRVTNNDVSSDDDVTVTTVWGS